MCLSALVLVPLWSLIDHRLVSILCLEAHILNSLILGFPGFDSLLCLSFTSFPLGLLLQIFLFLLAILLVLLSGLLLCHRFTPSHVDERLTLANIFLRVPLLPLLVHMRLYVTH